MKPKIAVFGLGEYYRKLRPWLESQFALTALIDTADPESLALEDHERQCFIRSTGRESPRALCSGADAALVLTPPSTHVALATDLIAASLPVFIEKPVCVGHEELAALRRVLTPTSSAYFSDFYVDVRATPLLWAFGKLGPKDWRRSLLVWNAQVPDLQIGKPKHIDAGLFETYSLSKPSWLAHAEQGGVVLDMMVHLLALLRELFPAQALDVSRTGVEYYSEGAKPGEYKTTPEGSDQAEAFAFVEGYLRPLGTTVRFQVAKHARQQNRYFRITGEDGFVEQFFETDHPLAFEMAKVPGEVLLAGDRYDLTVRSFAEWLTGPRTLFGWDSAHWATATAINLRERARENPRTFFIRSSKTASPADDSIRGPADSPDYERRRFILGLVTLGVASVTGGVTIWDKLGKEHKDSYCSTAFQALRERRLDEWDLVEARKQSISRLFSLPRVLKLAPGTDHRYGKRTRPPAGEAYPHDARALEPFSRYLAGSFVVLHGEMFPTQTFSSDTLLIQTGSPSSSSLARGLMERPPTDAARIVQSSLRYSIREDLGARPVKVISGMEGAVWVDKKAKELVDVQTDDRLYHDDMNVSADRHLQRDVLLVSRLPSPELGCDVLFVSGGHGAGTQAIELLFRTDVISDFDLGRLSETLEGARYWQFVLEVDELEHRAPMTVAQVIRVSSIAPPAVLRIPEPGVLV